LPTGYTRQKVVGVHSYSLVDEIVENWISHGHQRLPKKFFGFLPITYQIDIRTARFLEKIRAGKNLGFFEFFLGF